MTTRRDCLCSLHAASRIFGKPRESIRKLIANANLQPAGEERGHSLYAIRSIAELLYDPNAKRRKSIEEMTPSEANLHWQSELRRIEVDQRAGRLVWAEDCRNQIAYLVKTFTRFLDILPDVLERDVGISTEQIVALEKTLFSLREDLYQQTIADAPGDRPQ
jgi:hypothetical protein